MKYWKLEILRKYKEKYLMAECLCDCWNKHNAIYSNIIKWDTKSCWCLFKEKTKWNKYSFKHWLSRTRIYRIWHWMKVRCKQNIKYIDLWFCEERKDFKQFYFDMNESYEESVKINWEKNTTLDRIDNSKWYSKENCRWATLSQQQTNKNTTRKYKWKSLMEWCQELWLKYWTMQARMNRNHWDWEKCLPIINNKWA